MGETRASVFTGEVVTRAVPHRAVFTREAQRARAGEVVNTIHAGAAVTTGVAGTVVDVDLTARSGEARTTAARDPLTQVHALSSCRDRR